jgi:hypothetical protein
MAKGKGGKESKEREHAPSVPQLPAVFRDVERKMNTSWASRIATGEFNIENLHGDDPSEGLETQDFDDLSLQELSGFQVFPTMNHFKRSLMSKRNR